MKNDTLFVSGGTSIIMTFTDGNGNMFDLNQYTSNSMFYY